MTDRTPLDRLDDPDDGDGEAVERAERRGLGRGLLAGIVAVAIVALVLIWCFTIGPLGHRDSPAQTAGAPVTTLPDDAQPRTSSAIPTPGDSGPAQPPATAATPSENANATPSGAPSGSLTVALTRWNWIAAQHSISVAGFLPDVVEAGGTCTLTATSGGVAVTATAPAEPDAHSTVCAVDLEDARIASGAWQVALAYDGPSGRGQSASGEVTVP